MRVMRRSGLSNPINTRWTWYPRDLALRSRSILPRLERVVSTAKLNPRLRQFAVRFKTSLPAAMAAADGFKGFKLRAIVSGSSSRSRPSKSRDKATVVFPEPFGPAITVRDGTPPQAACAVNSRTIL